MLSRVPVRLQRHHLTSHLLFIRPQETTCLQFGMIFTCVKSREQIILRIGKRLGEGGGFLLLSTGISSPPPRPPSLFVLLGRSNQITPITSTKSFLQLNYAETRLGQLENCHCEKTCQVSGLLYRDQDSWVDGDNCRNCTCKVSPRRKQARRLERS